MFVTIIPFQHEKTMIKVRNFSQGGSSFCSYSFNEKKQPISGIKSKKTGNGIRARKNHHACFVAQFFAGLMVYTMEPWQLGWQRGVGWRGSGQLKQNYPENRYCFRDNRLSRP